MVHTAATGVSTYAERDAEMARPLLAHGIDALPDTLQQAAFVSTYAGLGIAAFASATAYESARGKSSSVWWDRWETWSAFSLGVTLVFSAASAVASASSSFASCSAATAAE